MKHTNTGTITRSNPFFKYLFVLVLLFSTVQSFGQTVCSGPIVVDAPSAPVIDGIVDPVWAKAPAIPITKTVYGTLQSDYAATWQAMYDNTYLYVLIKVTDKKLVQGQSTPSNNDGIEIYIDANNSKTTTYGAGDFQYGFSLATPVIQPVKYGKGSNAGVLSAMPNVPGGYDLEVAIPWSTIGGSATPGRQIGFDININDDDNGSSRDATSGWFSTSTQLAVNPSLFGTVPLTQCIDALALQSSHTDPNCGSTSDGTITMIGGGGTTPYSYNINGGAFTPNNVFTGLGEGTYKVSIKDASTPTPLTVDTSITLATAGSSLAANNDTSVCPGSSVKLSATGGISNNYTWTASPADPTLTIPNSATATVTPAVTTSYTVTTAALGTNLIANPGFENGNVGFTSAYTYNTSSTFQSKIYSIESNPSTYNNFFTTCGDHTTGTGKMMVIDGGATPTDLMWGQTVPVLPNSTYILSYWIQTVDIGTGDDHQAQIDTRINGVSQGIQKDPVLGLPCGNWVKASYTWNSGAATSAQIYMYDLQTSTGGNDFAIDDISFTTGCTASKTVKVTVAVPPAPTTTIAQPTCTLATGTITVTAPSTGVTYSFDNGGTYQASAISSALAGNATYQVKVKNTIGCISSATAAVLNSQPSTPAAPTATVTQATCTTATGTITVTIPANGVTYSFDNGGTYQASATSPALTANATYQVVVKTAAGCISPATAVTLNAQPPTPAAPVVSMVQATCTVPTGTITVTAPTSGVTYSFDNGGTYQASSTSPSLAANATYQVIVKNTAGCSSPATAAILAAPASAPNAPTATITQPTCATATGTINITAPTSGVTYSFDNGGTYQASATASGLAANTTYQLIVKSTAGCLSTATPVTLNAQPTTTSAPTTTTVQPTCATATGTITVTAPTSGVTYSFDNGGTYQASATSPSLAPNATYQVVVKTTAGCISPATAVILNAQPATPAAPTVSMVQATCTVSTGTITVTAPPSGVTYSFDNGGTYQASATSPALAASATYQVVVKNTAGCSSSATAAILAAPPSVPNAPTAVVTQPTCTTATGTINITAPTSSVTYSFDNGASFQASATSSALAAGSTYQLIVKNTAGCLSTATPVTLNAQPTTTTGPTTTTIQPTCSTSTGTITVTVPASGVTYSFDNGGTYQASATSPSLAANTMYQVVVKTTAGCISPATPVMLNTQPATPAAPTVSIIQPTCTTATGTVNITAPSSDVTYSFDNGTSYQASSTATTLTANTTYQVIVKTTAGCISSATPAVINVQPPSPAAPTVTTVQPTCTVATGSIAITAPSSGVTYSFDNGKSFQVSPVAPTLSTGNYFLQTKNTLGCVSAITTVAITAPISTVPPPSVSNVVYCQDDKAVSIANLATGNSLTWYSIPVGGGGATLAPIPSTDAAGVFSYYVTQSQGFCESSRAVVTVTVHGKPLIYAGGPVVYIISGESVKLKATANSENINIMWTPDIDINNPAIVQPTVDPTTATTYTMTVTGTGKCVATDTVNVIVTENIFVPNVFSPNGDGVHDTWLIDKINEYPGAQVKIFNRYGQLILESNGYNQPWDGTYNGKPVPVGAYYYIIKLRDDLAPIAGAVSIVR